MVSGKTLIDALIIENNSIADSVKNDTYNSLALISTLANFNVKRLASTFSPPENNSKSQPDTSLNLETFLNIVHAQQLVPAPAQMGIAVPAQPSPSGTLSPGSSCLASAGKGTKQGMPASGAGAMPTAPTAGGPNAAAISALDATPVNAALCSLLDANDAIAKIGWGGVFAASDLADQEAETAKSLYSQ
jgi:hypothetical protein